MTATSRNNLNLRGLKSPRLRVAPSVLAADFGRLEEEIRRVEEGGADLLHLDIMDGHFVPNISFGVPVIEKLRPISKLFFDTHLMIAEPARYAEAFVQAGADLITFHIEVRDDPRRVIDAIRRTGAGVGVSLKPGTPADAVFDILPLVDLVLVMTVEPGFGGQSYMPEMETKIDALRPRLRPDQRLEVDGGIDATTAPRTVRVGADTLVAGSSIFGQPDSVAAMNAIRSAAERVLRP